MGKIVVPDGVSDEVRGAMEEWNAKVDRVAAGEVCDHGAVGLHPNCPCGFVGGCKCAFCGAHVSDIQGWLICKDGVAA